MKYDNALLLAALAVGMLTGAGIHAFTHRHYHEVIKTNIGEFIIDYGKIYSVYEMQRNINGDMVGR
jgi:hypothetical protein